MESISIVQFYKKGNHELTRINTNFIMMLNNFSFKINSCLLVFIRGYLLRISGIWIFWKLIDFFLYNLFYICKMHYVSLDRGNYKPFLCLRVKL